MHATSKVFVAGHRGLVGSAIVRRLEQDAVVPLTATRDELDLRNQAAVIGGGRERHLGVGTVADHQCDALFLLLGEGRVRRGRECAQEKQA